MHVNIFSILDLNECILGTHLCEHTCGNDIGSYQCICDTGYQLEGNGLNCSGIIYTLYILYVDWRTR